MAVDWNQFKPEPEASAGSGGAAVDWSQFQPASGPVADQPEPGGLIDALTRGVERGRPVEGIRRGATSTLASAIHTIADTLDQALAPTTAVYGYDPLGFDRAAAQSLGVEREINADRQAAAERIGGRPSLGDLRGNPLAAIEQGVANLTNLGSESVPAMALAIATRNPELGTALMGGTTGAQEYTDLRGQGVDRARAAQAAGLTGAIEAAGESIGLPAIMGKAGKGSLLRAAAENAAQEAPVQLGQQYVEDQTTGRETPVLEQLGSALDAALVGGLLGAGGHAAVNAPEYVQAAAGKLRRKPSDTSAPAPAPGQRAPLSPEAEAELDELLAGASPSAVRAAPAALPPPTITVDRQGNAMNAADFMRQLRDTQDAAARKRELGITPDIERTQGVRWAKQAQQVDAAEARRAALAEIEQRQAELDAEHKPATGRGAQPDEGTDDALTFLAKRGGLSRAEFTRQGVDPVETRQPENRRRGGVSRPLFRASDAGGMTLDQAAEALWQHGYLPEQDNNAALDLIQNGLRGEPAHSIHRADQNERMALEQQRRDIEAEPVDDFADVPFSFAGERARTADRGALQQAQAMEAMGRDSVPDRFGNQPGSPEDTHLVTGWHRGVDGRWRFEIDDSAARVDEDGLRIARQRNEPARLGDVLHHPDLLAAYPDLADVRVRVMPGMRGYGAYNPGANTIDVRAPSEYRRTGEGSLRSVLLHEIQHAIQNHEGFARGGSPKEARSMPEFEQLLRQSMAANEGKLPSWTEVQPGPEQLEQEAAHRVYRRLAGEVEARNTQHRLGMSAAERRATPPTETADVPRGEQIVRVNSEPGERQATSHDDAQAIARYNARLTEYIGKAVRLTPASHVPDAARRALAAFDAAFGSRSIVVRNETPDALDFNGVTLRDGVRMLNEDATAPLLTVAGHELIHQLRKDAPELYAELAGEIRRQGRLEAYGAEISERAAASGDTNAPHPEAIVEELVADAAGDAITDPEFMEQMAQRNPRLFRRVADQLLRFLASVTRKLRSLGSSRFLEDVEAFRDRLADVLERYAERKAGTAAQEDLSPEPMFSRKPAYTDEQKEFLRKAGMAEAVDERGAIRKALDGLQGKIGKPDGDAFRQGAIDKFHGIKRAVDEKGGIAPEDDPYLAAEMIQTASTMEAILRFGAPELHRGALRVKRDVPGLLDALTPVRDQLPQWLGWMVARRAQVLKAQGRENALSDANIAAGLSLAKGHEAEFKAAALGYLKLKNAILDLAEQTGIIDPAARKAWDHAEYIPFYRDMDAGFSGPGTRQGLANQSSGIRTLKGGESPLKDPLGNIIANFTRLVDSSMKNRATLLAVDQLGAPYFRKAPLEVKAETIPLDQVKRHLLAQGVDQATIDGMPPDALKGVARMLAVKAPEGEDIVRVMRGGKAEYYHVDDPLLLRSLTAFNEGGTHWSIKPLVWFKQLLTAGATATPDFLLRNALRDTGEASVTSRDRFIPVVDTVRGAVDSLRESELAQDLMMAGAAFHGGLFHTGSNEDTAKAIRRALRKHGLTDSAAERYVRTLINPKRLWDVYRTITEATEMGSRVSIARKRLAAGATPVEAAHEAKDFLNFQRRGDDKFVQAFTKVIPFLNARLQGGDRLYRVGTTKGRRGKVAVRLATMAMLTTLLYWWNQKEHKDAYDEIPEWDKDANWHIAPGTDYHLRIPKPFELGLVGGTLPERLYGALRYQLTNGEAGDRPEQDWDAFMRALSGTLGINPIPQGAMPIVEDIANKDFYFGSPIESMGDQYKAPSDRYGPTTSPTLRAASKGMAALFGENHTLSPKRLQHFWRGYTAGMGSYLLEGADWVTRRIEHAPETPDLALRDYPLVGTVARGGGPARSTRYVDEFYDLAEKAQMRSAQVKDAVHNGDRARAARLEQEWGWLLGQREASSRAKEGFMHSGVRELNRLRDQLGEISKGNAKIYTDERMSGAAKRKALDANLEKRNAIVRKAVRAIRERERKAGR